MALLTPSVDVRRAADRFATDIDWLDSKHSFSFGHHYDPRNTHFGLLLVNNDDVVAPGTGFETHPHRDMEIVTWVLRGGLVHQDSQGHNGLIYPGLAQRMSAGTGILHSEKNDSWRLTGDDAHTDPVHFVQMWVVPDEPASSRATSSSTSTTSCCGAASCPVASGRPEHKGAAAIRSARSTPRCSPRRVAPGGAVRHPGRAVRAPLRRRRLGRARGRRARWTRVTRPGSPAARASGSPPVRRAPRCWSGRCTPASRTDPPRPDSCQPLVAGYGDQRLTRRTRWASYSAPPSVSAVGAALTSASW